VSINSLNKFPDENPNPVMRLSKQGLVLYGNNASEVLLDSWGQRGSDFIHGRALRMLYRAVEDVSPIVDDFECQDRVYTVTFMPIASSNYVNVYALDTTEKKEMENALKAALQEVRQLRNRLQEENRYLREEIKQEIGFDTIIGDSDAQTRLTHKINQVAPTDATVLITGETGTGKELIARAIHATSLRRGHPLIKINCAALPTELIESELFGHQKGAFTGALANKKGRFELADGGTLFLDEIGDIPLESQSKLLRALQEQEFERVGGTKTIKVDVRVIAATNRVLVKNIAQGEFREDLYYRLNVFPIHSPPLRERREDIATLAYHFLGKYSKKIGKRIDCIDGKVMQRLETYHWPGNVRELENIIERAVILTEGQNLQLDEAFEINSPPLQMSLKTLGEVEQEMIQSALEQCKWKIEGDQGAAIRLAMAPSTLRERIRKYGLERRPAKSAASEEQI
jgi:transcriptional regulator with GAF, ATPase, and Fis domain